MGIGTARRQRASITDPADRHPTADQAQNATRPRCGANPVFIRICDDEECRGGRSSTALGRCPRADPDRLRSDLVPTGGFEHRHTPRRLATAAARLGLDLRSLAYRMTSLVACLLCAGPLGGTAHAFTLAHQSPPCPRPTRLAALIVAALARNANEPQRCTVVHTRLILLQFW